MFKNWCRLRFGLMTLIVFWPMLALSLSTADAAKPPTPPPPPPPAVSYTIAYSRLPVPPGQGLYVSDLYATGMNNYAQVVAWGEIMTDDDAGNGVVVAGEGYVWKWTSGGAQNPPIPLTAMILDPAVHVVPSAELQAMWGATNKVWPFGVLGLRFENATINDFGQGTTPSTDFGQIAAEFEFSTADGGVACHAFRYTPAQGNLPAEFLDLDVPAGWGAISVQSINNLGNVVGVAEVGTDAGSLPVFWDCAGAGDPLNNDFNSTPELINGRALAINDSDQITGSMLVGGAYHAFRYTPTATPKLKDLGVLYTRNPGSIGLGINNLGVVAGWSYVTRPKDSWWERYGAAHAFRYDTSMVDLSALTVGGSTRACWINDSGNVVGSARSSSPDWTPTWFLYTGATGMLDLLKLINGLPAGTTGDTCSLVDINDYSASFGQICGTIEIDGVKLPFILTPNK